MMKTFSGNKTQSGHATNALSFAVALMLAASLMLNEASAQMYATASSSSLLSDGVLLAAATQSGLDEEGDGSYYILPDRLRRAVVALSTREAPGTVIIDTGNTTLYYVIGQGRAIRYGVGVGREGFTWSGTQTISRKAEWPDWHPPVQMIERQPYLPRFVAGGPGNPLGARAMYLGSSQYRIHGTNDPSTIGKFVSSGCIRLTNEDVTDLYSRIHVGTKVVVLPKSSPHVTAREMITVRPTTEPSRAVAATLPSGRKSMKLSASAL